MFIFVLNAFIWKPYISLYGILELYATPCLMLASYEAVFGDFGVREELM